MVVHDSVTPRHATPRHEASVYPARVAVDVQDVAAGRYWAYSQASTSCE